MRRWRRTLSACFLRPRLPNTVCSQALDLELQLDTELFAHAIARNAHTRLHVTRRGAAEIHE
jgi:hypothetical protein